MNRNDEKVLKLYLKFGLTRRAIERILRMPPRHGKSAQDVIDKYGVRAPELRGRLLGCHKDQLEEVKKQLTANASLFESSVSNTSSRGSEAFHVKAKQIVNQCVPEKSLGLLGSYRDRALIATDTSAFYESIKGEVANITQKVFEPCKGIVGACENRHCGSSRKKHQLDTAHIGQPRPRLFARSATLLPCSSPLPGQAVYDLYESVRQYLRCHLSRRNRVRFLCKKCHRRLDSLQKQSTLNKLSREQKKKLKAILKTFKSGIH
jgi:hypothetical protein